MTLALCTSAPAAGSGRSIPLSATADVLFKMPQKINFF